MAILDKLDHADGQAAARDTLPRYRYRIAALHLELITPGATAVARFAVPARWLSSGGLGCLHGFFVHAGTACRLALIALHGAWDDVEGSIETCRHVTKSIHSLNLRFARSIDPTLYCAAAAACRVLLVEDDQFIARMVGAWLSQLNSTVEHVADGQAAIDKAAQTAFDLVLLDLDLPILDGFQVAKWLRAHSFSNPIIAISSLATPEVEQQALESGCDGFLSKPFDRAQVTAVIESLHEEPVLSTLHGDESLAGLVADFALALPRQTQHIRDCAVQQDLQKLWRLISDLRSQSGIYGFDGIAANSQAVLNAITMGARPDHIRRQVSTLLKLCANVRSPKPAAPSAAPPRSSSPPGEDAPRAQPS